MTSENFDKTSDSVVFPYMKEGFDGREFLKNKNNFAEKREIKSVKIFEMGEGNSACSEANSSLGNHCIDLAFSHKARTQSPLS